MRKIPTKNIKKEKKRGTGNPEYVIHSLSHTAPLGEAELASKYKQH
jgi:hypothetical protein